MTRYSHAAAHRASTADRWAEFKTELWWKREHLRDFVHDPQKRKDWIAVAVARRLPDRVKYWAAIDVCAFATTGRYSSTVVPEVRAVEVLERWHRCH